MKITKSQLKQIVKEEITRTLSENISQQELRDFMNTYPVEKPFPPHFDAERSKQDFISLLRQFGMPPNLEVVQMLYDDLHEEIKIIMMRVAQQAPTQLSQKTLLQQMLTSLQDLWNENH